MATLASDVFTRSRAVLNDVAIDLYTNDVLLPYLKIANDDLSDELVDNGGTVQKEVTIDITVPAGNKVLTSPEDLIVPQELYEKNVGEDDSKYRFMTQKEFLPNGVAGKDLNMWCWREQVVSFIGATQAKSIRMRYYRLIIAITGENSQVELSHAMNYLAYHTAALAAEHIGQNRSKAIDLEGQALIKLSKLIKKEVKQSHHRPTRRRPFRLNRFVSYT